MLMFNEKYHSYYWIDPNTKQKISLESTTRFLSKFKKPFDKENKSIIFAKKHNMEVKDVLSIWSEKGKRSTDFGTQIHKNIENFLKYKTPIKVKDLFLDYLLFCADNEIPKKSINTIEIELKSKNAEYNLNIFFSEFLKKYEIHSLECRICDLDLRIAGTYDCIIRDKETGKLCLIDWKTNKEIRMYSKYNNLMTPLDHLDDCEFINYSLQLSLYKYMLSKKGLEIDKMYIVHITDNVELIEVNYLKNEIDLIRG